MENAISLITSFPTTKESQKKFIDKLINEVESGYYSPLECEIGLKALEVIIKAVRNKTKELIIHEASKYEKTFKFKGIEITQTSKTTYDYSVCNDKTLNQLKEQIKIRESQLKSGVDVATGEVLIKPAIKISSFISISFPK